jgi:two-component system LytT family response regulator
MNIRVAILDDEPLARLAVKLRLAQHGGFELVGEFGDGDSAHEGILALRPDLVFVDVEMPGRTGLEVLAALPPGRRPMAILLTAYENFALQAFDLAALDYLLKPVDDDRLDEALARARQAFPYRAQARTPAPAQPAMRSFSVRVGTRTVLVPVAEVERIEADGDYATLHANGKTWLVRERLQNLALQLDPQQFHRVHRSAIVRLDMIAELRALTNRDALLRLRDGSVLRASRTYMPALTEALRRFASPPQDQPQPDCPAPQMFTQHSGEKYAPVADK